MMASSAFFAGAAAAATSSLNHHPNALPFNLSTIKPSPSPQSILSQPRRRSFTPSARASDPSLTAAATSSGAVAVLTEEEEEAAAAESKIGAKVRVKVPLKVYHVPKVPEVELEGREGTLKQYVGVWKGKRISANLPFKIEFFEEVEGRGQVKFFAHLKADEFEYL